jgi:hypothetical protein
MRRRAVITGIGVRAPGSSGAKEFWDLLSTGRTATRRISFFDPEPFRSQVAGECDFDPAARGPDAAADPPPGPGRAVRRGHRPRGAGDSGLDRRGPRPGPHRRDAGQRGRRTMQPGTGVQRAQDSGPDWVVDLGLRVPAPVRLPGAELDGGRGRLGGRRRGPGHARLDRLHLRSRRGRPRGELIAEGSADVMIAGASDAPISPITVACFDAIQGHHAAQRRAGDTRPALRPVPQRLRAGEGAAVFVLEEYEHARRRGAHIYAEVAGFATRCNAYHMTGLRRTAVRWPRRSRRADDQAGSPRRPRLHQRARLGHQAERPARDRRVQAQPRGARLRDAGQLHQVDDRALARRDRLDRDRRLRCWRSSTAWSRRPRTCTNPTRSATSTTSHGRARAAEPRTVLTSAAASAASRARWCSPPCRAA